METGSNQHRPRPLGRGCQGVLHCWLALLPATSFAAALNDTGQSQCYDGSTMVACTAGNTGDGAAYPRQDGRYGRDAAATTGYLIKSGGGAAGFDFTKICNNGQAAGTGSCPATPSLGPNPTDWACTLDNTTGLTWEVKTATATDLRYFNHTYTWYSTDNATNGGNAGSLGSDTCGGTLAAPPYNNQCNTANYVAAVNAVALCNYTDWRLPRLPELQGLPHFGVYSPSIDSGYFPNTLSSYYWTATNYAASPADAWVVHFGNGLSDASNKADNYDVRLVRGGQ